MLIEIGKICFSEFRIEPEKRRLYRNEAQIRLANLPFQVLLYLIENRERIVKRDELLDKFWDGRDAYDTALTKCVGAIRKALDDPHDEPRFIETRWAEGYRFIGNIEANLPNDDSLISANTDKIKILSETNGHQTDNRTKPASTTDEFIIAAEKTSGHTDNTRINSQPTTHLSRLKIAAIFVTLIFALTLSFIIYAFTRSLPEKVSVSQSAPRSIAVLPFKNLTGDAANEYLADGVTESIINEVSRVESLRVVSRSSVFQFKDKDISPEEIARKLNVETILEGAVRRIGARVRVEARLVNAKDGSILWTSDSPEKDISDIFAIQNEIVCQFVAKLQLNYCRETLPAERDTPHIAAYQAYLKGLAFRNQMDLPKACEFYKEALQIDPSYAPAHEGLAVVYTLMEVNSQVPPQTVAPLAEFHANKALESDGNAVGAYLALGTVKTLRNYDLNERIRYYREAVRRNPNYPTARRWLATALLAQGKFEEAETELLRVQESDPLSYGVRLNLAELYYYWRKPDKSIEQANMMLIANPENTQTHNLLYKAYLQKGLIAEADAEYQKYDPNNSSIAILVATGQIDSAKKAAESYAHGKTAQTDPYLVGCLFAGVGEKEKALLWLEKAYEMRQADLISLKIDPAFDNLRDDPRYQKLLARVGLADP